MEKLFQEAIIIELKRIRNYGYPGVNDYYPLSFIGMYETAYFFNKHGLKLTLCQHNRSG